MDGLFSGKRFFSVFIYPQADLLLVLVNSLPKDFFFGEIFVTLMRMQLLTLY